MIDKNAEFENYARTNREPVKRFQKWDRMGKLRRPCGSPSLAVPNTLNILRCDDIMKRVTEMKYTSDK